MTGALVARWRQKLRPSTTKNYRNDLRHICAALTIHGAPPMDLPKLPRPHQRATTATPDELARLLKQPAPWLRLFLLLYFQCGLRRSETLRVTARTWNREAHTLTLTVKGDRIRTVSITPDVETLLRSAGDPDPDTPFLWILRGRPLTPGALNRAWDRHKKLCGVNPNLTAHDLRRTAATILYTATKDLRHAQELLGHKNLASTLSYLAPLHPDDARKYAELLRFDRFHTEVKQ